GHAIERRLVVLAGGGPAHVRRLEAEAGLPENADHGRETETTGQIGVGREDKAPGEIAVEKNDADPGRSRRHGGECHGGERGGEQLPDEAHDDFPPGSISSSAWPCRASPAARSATRSCLGWRHRAWRNGRP